MSGSISSKPPGVLMVRNPHSSHLIPAPLSGTDSQGLSGRASGALIRTSVAPAEYLTEPRAVYGSKSIRVSMVNDTGAPRPGFAVLDGKQVVITGFARLRRCWCARETRVYEALGR